MINAIPVLVKGDTKQFEITDIKNIDDTFYTLKDTDKIYMDIKKSIDSDVLIHKEITSANYTPDGALSFSLYPRETVNLNKGEYIFDIRLFIDENTIFTIISESKLYVVDNVTEIPKELIE